MDVELLPRATRCRGNVRPVSFFVCPPTQNEKWPQNVLERVGSGRDLYQTVEQIEIYLILNARTMENKFVLIF